MTTKRFRRVLATTGLLAFVTGCSAFQSAGPQTTQERTIQGVTAVELLTSGDLTITIGTTEALTVTAGANQLTGLTSQVIDGTLILDTKGSISGDSEISYALTVAPLERVDLSGSGDASGSGVLRGDATLSVTGSGSANLTDLELSGIVVDISGSGDVQLAGRAVTQRVTVSGSGNYNGSGLATEETTVEVTGSGNAQVQATERLSATTSGSGDVTYTGDPADIERDSSGSGEIIPG
jgi:hypothetical protein